jgi:hypothetical protein
MPDENIYNIINRISETLALFVWVRILVPQPLRAARMTRQGMIRFPVAPNREFRRKHAPMLRRGQKEGRNQRRDRRPAPRHHRLGDLRDSAVKRWCKGTVFSAATAGIAEAQMPSAAATAK